LIAEAQTWLSNGKLLITGEYLVMEGALSLAIPINKHQSLSVRSNTLDCIVWKAYISDREWFTATFGLLKLDIIDTDNHEIAKKLQDILVAARQLSSNFLSNVNNGFDVETIVDFNIEYGFGTSSTLISNIAMWANVNPYDLLAKTFGGSGYDIACARSVSPILYQRLGSKISVKSVEFSPKFKDKLFFVYLGKKQKSSDSIKAFKNSGKFSINEIDRISDITSKILNTNDFDEFKMLIDEHEKIMSKVIGLPTVKSLYFSDLQGSVKSLGAWGGDFVMVASDDTELETRSYLLDKGFDVIFGFAELV